MQNNFLQDDYHSCHVILEAEGSNGVLLLGDFNAAIDSALLQSYNVKTIITAAQGLSHLEYDPHIKHITYPLLDAKGQNISSFFEDSFHHIEQSLVRGGVIIHCAAGISRSATLVIAYLMKKYKWTFRKAIDFVRKKRPCICPNLGFEMQLKAYEKELTLATTGNHNISQIQRELMATRSKNIFQMDFESLPIRKKQTNPQRGSSFPSIPHQTRNLLRRKPPPTRNGLVSQQRDRQIENEPRQLPGTRHSSIIKDNLIISSLTGYQNKFLKHDPIKVYRSRQKHIHTPPEEEPQQLARNLAKMMFGSHMHKWTPNKVVEEHVNNLARARKRFAHLKK